MKRLSIVLGALAYGLVLPPTIATYLHLDSTGGLLVGALFGYPAGLLIGLQVLEVLDQRRTRR